jgi:glycine hydroxymethyltransferase
MRIQNAAGNIGMKAPSGLTRRQTLRLLASVGISGPLASALAAEAHDGTRLRQLVSQWKGLEGMEPPPIEPMPAASVQYLAAMDAKFSKLTPRQIAARVKELSFADAIWRRRKCISLRAAEGVMGASAQALLSSSLATRVSEGFPGAKGYAEFRGTDEYIDEVEAAFIHQIKKLFKARYVEWRPLSNSMANAMPYLVLTKPGDVVMAQHWIGGGANAANTPVGPGGLKDLNFVEMPFLDNYEHDIDGIRKLAREVKPRIIVAGGGYVLFPYPLHDLRAISDEIGAVLMFDAAHLAILVAGGVFQQPLEEGADLMTMSTHKAFGGPVGGVVLTNQPQIAAPIMHRTVNGFIQTRDANKYVAAAYALAEVTEYGAACARQMVSNAQAFAAALDEEGFKPLARNKGYTRTHHVIVDVAEEGPAKVRGACMNCNILVQGASLAREARLSADELAMPLGLRLSTAEITRLGMKEPQMKTVARFMRRAVNGESSAKLMDEIEEFVRDYQSVRYTFDV